MDVARLSAAALALALGACRGARAETGAPADGGPGLATAGDPRHGVDVPAGWRELPEAGARATDAATAILGAGAAVQAHAWGEPSRGCYLAIVAADGARRDKVADVAEELQAALGEAAEVTEWTQSPDSERSVEVQARFRGTAAPLDRVAGLLHVNVVADRDKVPHAVAAACFYRDRQPAACESACAPLLAQLAPLESPP